MAITLKQLCKYATEKYKMIQISGDENTENVVDWVHMLEDPETAYFLRGCELIFTTGIARHDLEWFLQFAEGLVKGGASGWVINIGPYIEEVPEAVLDYCAKEGLPIFTVPWETRIVDITNDFCHRIIRAEESEVSVGSAFRNAIFFPNNTTQYKAILEGRAFDMSAEFSVLVLSLRVPRKEDVQGFEKSVRLHLSKILRSHSDMFSVFRMDTQLIAVLQGFDDETVEAAVERLSEVSNYGKKSYHLHCGYSGNNNSIESLTVSYRRAQELLKLSRRNQKLLVSYRKIGVQQLLIEVEDKALLKRFYDESIGILELYDEKHESDYYYILKCYLENNNSVEKVAKETFVHRNTINYKIKKIKEILNTDLSNEDYLKLMLAYKMKDLI